MKWIQLKLRKLQVGFNLFSSTELFAIATQEHQCLSDHNLVMESFDKKGIKKFPISDWKNISL